MKTILGSLIALLMLSQVAAAQQKLTYADLVRRYYDLEQLAATPAPGELCSQCSSYDRASRYDEKTGKYVAWDANGDGGGFIRAEGDKIVMAEMEGPGCIWRIWSAAPGKGHVRIYLDGATEPTVDLPFAGYFDLKNEPFTRPTLVHNAASGQNCYVPIPYQKSCKVVADKDWGAYYHFTYGTFPKGTVVPTFKLPLGKEDLAALDQAQKIVKDCGQDPAGKRAGEETKGVDVTAGAGGAATVMELKGSLAITAIKVKLDLPKSPADRDVLRELAIKITWDGEKTPAVWSPLGDFFGTAPGANQYSSLPLGLTKDGVWYCYWYMPFATSAKVELVNDGKEKRTVHFDITTAPLTKPVDKLMRFHAKWHRDALLPAEPERAIDWPMVKAEGTGRYVGVVLNIWNPKGGWWGEGDEKFFVDGEKFPSTFGTGSEDYFGYAWGNPELFANPYHDQTISEGNKGHISVNRWHIADSVPFQKSFEGSIEKYFPNQRPCLFAAVAYWYQAPGGKDPFEPLPLDQRIGYAAKPPPRLAGLLEAESMQVLAKTAGTAQVQDMSVFGTTWSDDGQLWWTQAKQGDKLDLALPVAKAGKYKLTMQLTKAIDYGIVQPYLDGKKLGEPIDLYSETVVPTSVIELGEQDLTAAEHKLTFEITGANPKAKASYMVGIDYVRLEPAK